MESEDLKSENRARKRRKRNTHDEKVERSEGVSGSKGGDFVGRYVRKEFVGYGVFLGRVVSYNDDLYRVHYEDGDFEDLDCNEIGELLVEEDDFDAELNARKESLDESIPIVNLKKRARRSVSKTVASVNGLNRTEASSISKLGSDIECVSSELLEADGIPKPFSDGDADSSSDSCEFVRVHDCPENEAPPIPPPPTLPPSSGNIGVPEESVSQLFSVYNFLRSFSIQLYLSPFQLDEFVGSLNCVTPNTLLDGVHFSLMRALRHHLEMLSSDGVELASKCLRRLDWTLLDAFTWPVYVVEYLLVMGYTKGSEWKGFYSDVLEREYYMLSVPRKLMILQILCDNVLESAELRAEIDMRESSEVGIDLDGTANLVENGPKRVHPRYSKTSACKDPEAMEIISESHELKSSDPTNILVSKAAELDTDAADVEQDENSDECRLCGMDGTLLCCDGCPLAYHSRCIGLSKLQLPKGSWFCPECTTTKTEPTLRIGAGLKGATIFGIDPYEQVFLGTCNHLLVLKSSVDAGLSSRYYNQNDIPKILLLFYSSEQHKILYSGICKGILEYWGMPENTNLSLPGKAEDGTIPTNGKEGLPVSVPSIFSVKENDELTDGVKGENCASSVIENNVVNGQLSSQENDFQEVVLNSTSLVAVHQAKLADLQRKDAIASEQVCSLMKTNINEQFVTESTISTGSISFLAEPSDSTRQSLVERSNVMEFATCASASGNTCVSNKKDADASDMLLQTKDVALSPSWDSVVGRNDNCSYMGTLFMPQSYINQYTLGDVAASAAANLAVLASEENQVSASQASSNHRKTVSANIAVQIKAFSLAAKRFLWPNSEKKLLDVSRERCGWCFSCKTYSTCKKGCLLNLAASNASKGSVKILGALRPIKNGEGNLPGIATYIFYMEENLRGLLVGLFLNVNYQRQWRKQVGRASTCIALKSLLLELEENIRLVAFSKGWVKLVDDWFVESSATQSGTGSFGPTPKRPGGRRNRKHSAASENAKDLSNDDSKNFSWWRGGKLLKLVFQKGILPRPTVRKAARQGGSRKISGIYYAEGSEIPKRTRRFAWRTAVEMSNNAAQLALQVRYLDLHVRWSDLTRPEQSIQDSKGPDNVNSAFRNAHICDKKIEENKISYGLNFSNQKHLPSSVMKNCLQVEQNPDGKDKLWFSETHIPLYLIKEYEEKVEKVPLPSTKKDPHILSELQRRQLKASRKDIFSYLMLKEEKLDKCFCASCEQDVLLRDAVKCNACQGFCHTNCTISATIQMKSEMELSMTCNRCISTKSSSLNESTKKPPISHVRRKGPESQMAVVVYNDASQNSHHQPLVLVGNKRTPAVIKSSAPASKLAPKGKRGEASNYGLIWKKKKNKEETDTNFRFSNILLGHRGNTDVDPSRMPTCFLCSKPYNSDLMYICCEICNKWYHADAIQLEEAQVFDVAGFKCCKGRKKSVPVCPYMDPNIERPWTWAPKQESTGFGAASETICSQPDEWHTTTMISNSKWDNMMIEEDDPLFFSLERVEPIIESTPEVKHELDASAVSYHAPQKLQVRRHVKCEKDANDSLMKPFHSDSTPLEANHFSGSEKLLSPKDNWELPIEGMKDEMFNYEGFNYDEMGYEPQTFFSFTELLETEEDQLNPFDANMDISDNWGNSSNYGAVTQYNQTEQSNMGSAIDNQEFPVSVEPVVRMILCHKCSQAEPSPDLWCEICGMWIHSHCSPWIEPSGEGNWRCGHCRDWQ